MSFRDHMVRKLSRSLCDKPDLNRRALQLRKCFAEADRIRDELKAQGIEITDTKEGASWRRV